MIDDILNRVRKVRKTGNGQWMACCPAHDDKTPSMTLRELPDGRILVHCFSGCEVSEILAAVGLEFDALFPPDDKAEFSKGEKVPFNPRDILRALAHESTVVAVASSHLQQGKPLSKIDHARLIQAVCRIITAAEAANV